MRFRRHLSAPIKPERLVLPPFLSLLFILILFLFALALTTGNVASINLSKTVTSDVLRGEQFIISLTAEQVIYFNNRVATMKELRQLLSPSTRGPRTILIKADRRASTGRLVDIWNLCRELGIEKINLATSNEK